MKSTNKKTTTKPNVKKRYPFTTAKTFSAGSREGLIFAQVPYTAHDFKNALLIVSLMINLFVLTLWLMAQVSQTYAAHIANFIAY